MLGVFGRVLGGWLLATACLAAGLQVTPILQEIPVGETTAVYQVRNAGQQPVTVQVSALTWHQEEGVRMMAETADIQITPPLMSLAPGQDEWVRVILKADRTATERAFRVLFTQVPETAQTLRPGVRTLLKLDTPLFFQAEEPETDLKWTLRHDLDGWHLAVRNAGTRFGRLTRLVLETDGGRRLPVSDGVLYVLPGTSQSWPLDLTDAEAHKGLSLQLQSGGQVQFQSLTTD